MTMNHSLVEVMPEGSLEILSQHEVNRLCNTVETSQHEILRRCALAVLNVGNRTDNTQEILRQYSDFDVRIVQQDHGIKLSLANPPAEAFVNGEMSRGIRELLFAVLRDIAYINAEVEVARHLNLTTGDGITNTVFHILRNAMVLQSPAEPDLVVCWGGHSIAREEYEYTKEVGYQLGLRKLNVCTGCGLGAMKGPMKGATIAHAKQRIQNGRYVGVTEPGIIAAESPNAIVNQLVILPDMEKRLEAFVRLAHAIVIFPGGPGTAEELLFLLGILMHPENRAVSVPLLLTGPESAGSYFRQIDEFIVATLGAEAQKHYRIELGNPIKVADLVGDAIHAMRDTRRQQKDAYYFNWRLKIDHEFQLPFLSTHEDMASLEIHKNQEPHMLAVHLRRAFSGVVTGNVKDHGIQAIETHGPFEIHGERQIMSQLDELLSSFAEQGRMRLPGSIYKQCYRIVI